MGNTYFIFEDSSQNYYGGGQRISKIIIEEILKKKKKIILFDTNLNSKFISDLRKLRNKNLKFQKIIHFNFLLNKENTYTILYLILKIFNLLIFFIPNFLILNIHALSEIKKKNCIFFLSNTTFGLIYKYFFISKIKHSIFYAHQYISNKFLIKFFLEKLLNSFDIIICVSRYISRNYKNIPERKKIIINTPQSLSNIKHKNFAKDFNVFSISNLISWKGVDIFLNSYKHLSPKNKNNIKYHVFGTGSEINKIKNDFNKNKNIYIHGYKSDNYINKFLISKGNLSIVPSLKEEACPHLPILSFSHAIPSIVTNIGGQSDLVKNQYNGFKVKPGSSLTISKKIDFLVNNKKKYIEISKNAKKTSYFFTFEKYITKICKALLLEVD